MEIKSTNPSDDDYSDLEQLKNKIGNSRIVLLGEQSHGDGTTFLMKTRLIKFLIKEMGFDVILFESGLFDCRKIDEFIKNGVPAIQAIRKGVFPIWNKSEQFQPLVEVIEKYRNELHIGGFDCQFTGEASKEFYLNDFEKYLKSETVDTSNFSNWPNTKAILKNISEERFIKPKPQPPTIDLQTDFLKNIQQIITTLQPLSNDSTPDDTKFWIQMLESSLQQTKSIWQSYGIKDMGMIPIETRIIRDIQMGKNLIWQANNNYPNKKIIVWAATFHIARNLPSIEVIGNPKMYEGIVTMGDVAWETLGNQLYAIGFTAYQGIVGWANNENKRTLEKPESNSLEDLFFKTGYENCFLDLRKIDNSGQWLKQRISSRPLGYGAMNSDWTNNLDGIVFTKEMIPSKKVSE
ncbi:MAG: erythromycin esterase family protein [Ignavibacteriales bacterium]|nr:erythromycin esterase family protein [Ignavibacteriales bacterium]